MSKEVEKNEDGAQVEGKWMTFRIYKSQVEAEVVFGLLSSNSIPCRMQGKDSVRPEISFATGIYIQIPEEYKEAAEELMPIEP